ncbi:hypothetical protein EVAR_72229_1, partial [Eumeta japonica]
MIDLGDHHPEVTGIADEIRIEIAIGIKIVIVIDIGLTDIGEVLALLNVTAMIG